MKLIELDIVSHRVPVGEYESGMSDVASRATVHRRRAMYAERQEDDRQSC